MIVNSFNPSIQEEQWQAGLWVRGQSGLHSVLQDSQSYQKKKKKSL